jgi:hypothetical protein
LIIPQTWRSTSRYEQGNQFGHDRDDGDDRDHQDRHIGERIAQHVRDPVVRNATQPGFHEYQSIDQPDHRNGDQDHQQLHSANHEDIELRTAPRRPMRRPDSAENAHRLVGGLEPTPHHFIGLRLISR